MLLILGLFDFPGDSDDSEDRGAEAPPELVVRRVTGS